jgi:flagellar biosynthesis protein FliR
MTASSIAVTVRGALKTAISGVAANTYDSVPESPMVPFAAVVPSNPYLEANLIGTSTRVKVNLVITVGVASYSNAASLDNIEQLVLSILAVIPSGYTVGSVSNPVPMTLASGSEIIACEIQLSTQYTQTN